MAVFLVKFLFGTVIKVILRFNLNMFGKKIRRTIHPLPKKVCSFLKSAETKRSKLRSCTFRSK